jgi:epoxyqueuosine reductase
MKLSAAEVKAYALEAGADAVAIGSIDRWVGAPLQQDPRQIMPEAKSVIAMAFRVMRGSLRGIEEGTYFSNYSAMGYGGITYLYMPMTVINISKMIEDRGHEAIPYGHQSDWRAINETGQTRQNFSRAVVPGRAIPDVAVNLRIASYLCGLGEIGWSKMFLTKQFGPRQRVGIIITDAELEADPIMKPGTLCNRCMACVQQCPGGAIPREKSVKVKLGGYDVEWADIDCERCSIVFRGAEVMGENDKSAEYCDPMFGKRTKPGWWSPFFKKPRNLYNTGQAICGARGCTRACMIAMESRGILDNKFEQPFRRRPAWKVDWQQAPESAVLPPDASGGHTD